MLFHNFLFYYYIILNLLICFGTRPEAIKLAPVIHGLKRYDINSKICVTAQHREMLDQVLEFFEITPDYDLDLMKAGQTLNGLSSTIFKEMDKVFDDWLGLRQAQSGLRQAQSDIVLVHGDTTTASIIAQAAFHRQIKVGHVEAGLRTYNKSAPYPEEINRQLIGRIADFHFAPTKKAASNLIKEQIPERQILMTGNTVVDALNWTAQKLTESSLTQEVVDLEAMLNPKKKLILVTGHRRENFGRGLEELGEALLELSSNPGVEVLYPVHLNPNVKEPIQQILGGKQNIRLVDPVSYPAMIWLLQRAAVIISDSGGIQEEAPAFGKPVLVSRQFSERMEGVEAGFSILTGTDKKKIVAETNRLLQNPPDLTNKPNPYGDGKAAERIVGFLRDYLSG